MPRFLALLIVLLAAGPALGHPHVWVSARAELVYADGKLALVRHHWTFDEAYSSFAVQGLDKNGDGATDASELADLARTNLESLAEFGYFTAVKANGAKQGFGPPRAETMTFANGQLTLHYDLPLAAPIAGRVVVLDVYDPTFFVDFQTAAGDDAVVLASAPAGCSVRITRPKPQPPAPAGKDLSETFFQGLSASSGFGAQFASRAMAACP